jgi:DNA-binding transcriptional LysR family regulator
VSLAAEELCLTHGAVSKQLTGLAAWIGQPLRDDD